MLPTGMTSLRKIRTRDCYYVDKTDHVRRLVEGGDYYFLSRPRRFGKTLLVDTLQELFEGSEELFRGLAIRGKWDWLTRRRADQFRRGQFRLPGPRSEKRGRPAGGDGTAGRPRTGSRRGGGPFPAPDKGAARARRAAGGRAGGRIRQADSGRARRPGAGGGQPRLPARLLRDDQGQRQASPFRFPDGSEQVLACGPVLWPEQPDRRYAGAGVLGHLRLHGRRTGRGLRPRTRRPGPGRDPALVQRLQLARAGEGLQPVRPAAAVSTARVPPVLVPERHADLPGRDAGAARPAHSRPGRHDRQREPAFVRRRGQDLGGGAAVPDRLPHHRGRGGRALQAGLPEPRGAPEPGRSPVGRAAPASCPREGG